MIAHELGKFAWEVEKYMPAEEFHEWVAFFALKREAEKKAMEAASKGSSRNKRRR